MRKSARGLRMNAAPSVIVSSTRCTAGRTCSGVVRAPGGELLGGADQVEQVGAFDVVELQGAGDGFEDVLGDAADVAAFELRVVLDADPGEHRHLLAAQPGDAAAAAVGAQAGLLAA